MLAPFEARRNDLEMRFATGLPRSLHAALDNAAAEFGSRPFVITDERTVTYDEMVEWTRRLASGLAASEVRPGDNVAVLMANCPEFVAVSYAISRVGATAVPINFLNRRDELGYVLRQSDAVVLVTMDRHRDLDYLGMLDELAPGWEASGPTTSLPSLKEIVVLSADRTSLRSGVMTLDELAARGTGDAPEVRVDPAAPATIPYTSGTTGKPKGVLLTHEMLMRTAYGVAHHRAFQDGRRVLFSLPLYHIYGYVEGLLAVPWVGGAVILQSAFDPAQTLRGIERHRANDVLLVPTMTVDVLAAVPSAGADLSSLTAVYSSGGYSPDAMWQQIIDGLEPEELFCGWGMTETTATSTCTTPGLPLHRLRTTNGRVRDVGAAGEAALGGRLVAHKIVDPTTGTEVPTGEVGELRVTGPGVTSGYYKKPDETAAAFDEDGWFRSGDLGRMDAEGYFSLAGRLKESYRCGGEQVMPKEVEDVLTEHLAVAQAFVVPLPDPRMGEVGVAWVMFKDGANATAEELVDHCRERVARFKVPRHVLPIVAADVPTTATGRPRKFLLSERARELLEQD